MPQARLRAHIAPPGGHGLRRAMEAIAAEGVVVSSWADPLLVSARAAMPEDFGASILPWGEWIRRLSQYAGINAPRIPSRGHLRALVSLATRALPGTSAFERTCRTPGAHTPLVNVFSELRAFSQDADSLRSAAAQASPALAARLTALGQIDELVRDSMDAAKLAFAGDLVDEIVRAGPPQAWPCNELVVLAGHEAHPRYEAFLRWLAANGLPVTVVVEAFMDGGPLFAPAHALVGRLRAKASPGLGPSWHRCLFGPGRAEGAPELICTVAPEPLAESEWAIRDAVSLGGAEGESAIVATDLHRYGPLLLAASRRLGVPVSAALPVPLSATGFARFCHRLLVSLARRDGAELALLAAEDYLGSAKSAPHGPSLTGEYGRLVEAVEDGRGPAWLAKSLAWAAAQPGRASLRDWLAAFRELVGQCLAGQPDLGSADGERDARAMTLVQQTIAEYAFAYDVAGEADVGLEEFAVLAGRLWDEGQVVQAPASGGIPVVHDPWSLGPTEAAVVVGAVEGSLPRGARQDPILLDEHRVELAEIAQVALVTSVERALAERDAFVRLCGSASRRIVLSRPNSDGDRRYVPAVYVSEARRALGVGSELARPGLAPEAPDAVLEADVALRARLDGPRSRPTRPIVTTDAARSAVRLGDQEAVDPAEARDYVQCPLRSTFRHRLPLQPPGRLGTSLLLGIPVRVGLPAIDDLDKARERLLAELDAATEAAAKRGRPHEVALLRATGLRWIDAWIQHEQASRQAWPRDHAYGPAEPGQAFEAPDGGSAVPVARTVVLGGEERAGVKGAVAGVIVSGEDVRVVLYARRKPSPDDPESEAVYRDLLALAASKRGSQTYFEVDSAIDGRCVDAYANGLLGQYLPKATPGLLRGRRRDGVELREALMGAGRSLRRVVQAMRDGVVAPMPAAHCRTCPVTELCRWRVDDEEPPGGGEWPSG